MSMETSGDGVFDPRNLHLMKKELTQAARVLRDPGTSSTCRSPLNSARSLTKIHYMNLHRNRLVDGNGISSSSEQFSQLSVNVREKEKRVVLYNWSSSDEESSLIRDGSDDMECLSDMQDCDSDKFSDISFRKRCVRKKSRSKYCGASWKAKKQTLLSKRSKKSMDGLLSDDAVNYYDSENLRRESSVSPLLSGIRNKNWSRSPRKGRSCNKEDDSDSCSAALSKRSNNSKYLIKNPSTVECLGSFSEADDEVDDDHLDFPAHQGCGIPCYWSKKSILRPRLANASCYSSSVSDTLRRRRSSETQIMYHKRNQRSVLNGGLLSNSGELGLKAMDELHEEESIGSVKTLSQKYRPVFFHEVIGQDMVIQSLTSAVSNGRIFPFYLFHGPRGTGKTSTAKIFAAALNCLAIEVTKPCGVCTECAKFISGKSKYLLEVDGSNKKGIYEIKDLSNCHPGRISKYKVIVVDDCHLLSSKAWLIYLRLLEKPLPGVVFVFVTTDIKNLPHTVLSRCEQHIFDNISIHDIVTKLRKIANDENLDVESDALELIASNADGSVQDAESMLDQLRLFGKRISVSLVTELIGVVSDDNLLELLELAMSSNASETVTRARQLLNTGVDPIALMSQMATVIVDIIAETYPGVNSRKNRSPFVSESEKDKLKHALMLLSEAAKHLRGSNEGSTWFTAILLQLGSLNSPNHVRTSNETRDKQTSTPSESSVRCNPISIVKEEPQIKDENGDSNPHQSYSNVLLNIWLQCVEKCQSKTLRLLLQSYGKLVSVSETKEGGSVAQIGFSDDTIKTTVEGFLSSITNAFEIVLQHNVEVKIILLPDSSISGQNHIEQNISTNLENSLRHLNISGDGSEYGQGTSKLSRRSIINVSKSYLLEKRDSVCGNANTSSSIAYTIPANRIDSLESMNSLDMFSPHWEGELNRGRKSLEIKDGTALQNSIIKRKRHHPASSSLLRNPSSRSNLRQDSMGYESGPGSGARGWTGLLCWKSISTQRKGKGKQGKHVRARTRSRLSWFGACAKSRRMENRYNI